MPDNKPQPSFWDSTLGWVVIVAGLILAWMIGSAWLDQWWGVG